MKDEVVKTTLEELYEPLKDIPDNIGEYVKKAEKWFKTHSPSFYGTANFAGLYKHPSSPTIKQWNALNAPCHSRISSFPMPDDEEKCFFEVIVTECGWRRRSISNKKEPSFEIYKPFVEWLVNSSYMSPMFIVKDIDFIKEFGFVLSTRVNAPLLQNALITTRHFVECSLLAFETWNTLVKEGVDPHFAYFICFNSTISSIINDSYMANSIFYGVSGHRALPVFTFEEMHNFYTQTCFLKKAVLPTYYSGRRNYTGGYSLFSNKLLRTMLSPANHNTFIFEMYNKENKIFPEFNGLIQKYRKDQNKVAGVIDPFNTKTIGFVKNPLYVYCDEILNVAIPFLKEKGLNFNGKEIFNLGRKDASRLRQHEDVCSSGSIQRQHRGNDEEGKLPNRIGSRRR